MAKRVIYAKPAPVVKPSKAFVLKWWGFGFASGLMLVWAVTTIV